MRFFCIPATRLLNPRVLPKQRPSKCAAKKDQIYPGQVIRLKRRPRRPPLRNPLRNGTAGG